MTGLESSLKLPEAKEVWLVLCYVMDMAPVNAGRIADLAVLEGSRKPPGTSMSRLHVVIEVFVVLYTFEDDAERPTVLVTNLPVKQSRPEQDVDVVRFKPVEIDTFACVSLANSVALTSLGSSSTASRSRPSGLILSYAINP